MREYLCDPTRRRSQTRRSDPLGSRRNCPGSHREPSRRASTKGAATGASVGQIIEALKDKTLADYFASAGQGSTAALQRARESYEDLLKGDLFDRAKWLRHDVVGHILIRDTPTPKVRYEDVYDLRDAAERIVTDLYAACGRRKPKPAPVAEQAKFFWDTYLLGMAR